jgi:hypothetical protein
LVLADERAVLAAMAYVDLNPIRAGMTLRLDHSHHTSIQQRVLSCRNDEAKTQQRLKPLIGLAPSLSLKQGQYIELVQWTGQQVRPDKKGAIPKNAPAALRKNRLQRHALAYSGKSGGFGLLANDWYDGTTHGKSRSHRATMAKGHWYHEAVSESLSLHDPWFPVTGE